MAASMASRRPETSTKVVAGAVDDLGKHGMFAGLPDPGVTGVLDTLRLARRRRVSVAGSYALVPLLAATGVHAAPAPRFERADWTALATAALFAHLVRDTAPGPVRRPGHWCRADTRPGGPGALSGAPGGPAPPIR